MEKEVILEVKNLKKNYGKIEAVKDVSFKVYKGSLFAFLGPNGAGKSTTINIITTLLKHDSGEYLVKGSSNDDFIRKTIGVVFQENVLDDLLTVKENLMYRGSLYINDPVLVNNRYLELVNKLDLSKIENQQFRSLSGGQKRRVEIARALFSNPEILLLDEPTTGLDPETRKQVWNVLENLKKEENITIFLTTHYMEEAANADYVVIIDKGLIKVEGTPNELKEKYSTDIMRIKPKNKKMLEKYATSSGITYEKVSDMYVFTLENTVNAIKHIENNKDNIDSFEVVKGSLDDVFVKIIGDNDVSVK